MHYFQKHIRFPLYENLTFCSVKCAAVVLRKLLFFSLRKSLTLFLGNFKSFSQKISESIVPLIKWRLSMEIS
jgi:hypothetical protein